MEVEDEEREQRVNKEEERRQTVREAKRTENRTTANSFDPVIATCYLLAAVVIDPGL